MGTVINLQKDLRLKTYEIAKKSLNIRDRGSIIDRSIKKCKIAFIKMFMAFIKNVYGPYKNI